MSTKKAISKVLKRVLFSSLVLGIISIPGTTYASNGTTPVPSTRVTITNTETGKVTQYNLNESSTQCVIDKDGERVFVSTFNIEDKRIMTRASQTNEDTLNGYKGTVKITYTDDGKYACLTRVFARWEKESGNSTISNMNLNYGQVLGTNSKKGHTTILEKAVDLTTGFKPGKIGYGLDFFLGATLNAKIGSDQVAIECNVNY